MKSNYLFVAVSTVLASSVVAAAETSSNIETEWSIESGIGYETNAYHAPDHDYIDYYADPAGTITVTPEEQAGVFIPLKVKTQLVKPIDDQVSLLTKYRFSGYYFPESALNDAGSTDHELNLGADFKLGDKGKKGEAYAGMFVRSHDKVYVDRDSGYPKTSIAGEDVSNRYTYKSFGFEGQYERKISRNDSVGIEAVLENLDYEDPVAWNQYDHTHLSLGAYLEHRLSRRTKLSGGVTTEVRDYSERHAYSANGSLLTSNPLLTYQYMVYELGIRHRFNDSTVTYLDYELAQRRDNHVGYNDMDQNSFKVRVIHDLNERLRMRAKVRVYDRDYANAFNFEDPAQGIKSSSALDVQLRGEYQWNKHKSYYLELDQHSRDNTDDRYQYNNSVMMLGAKWEY